MSLATTPCRGAPGRPRGDDRGVRPEMANRQCHGRPAVRRCEGVVRAASKRWSGASIASTTTSARSMRRRARPVRTSGVTDRVGDRTQPSAGKTGASGGERATGVEETGVDPVAERRLDQCARDWGTESGVHARPRVQSKCVQSLQKVAMPLEVVAYSNSDWAGCRKMRRSTIGGALRGVCGARSHWSCTKNAVALSLAEAGLDALSSFRV